jgi:hypothetical protein
LVDWKYPLADRAMSAARDQEETMTDDYYESPSKDQSCAVAGFCGIGMLIVWAGVGWWEIAKVFI